jgi:DNA-directed RNA polymerase subunit M/transcription elongation factor TFIIS
MIIHPDSPLHDMPADEQRELVLRLENSIFQAHLGNINKYSIACQIRIMNLDPMSAHGKETLQMLPQLASTYGEMTEFQINPNPTHDDRIYIARQKEDAKIEVRTSTIYKCPRQGCGGDVITELLQLRSADEMQSLRITCRSCGTQRILN